MLAGDMQVVAGGTGQLPQVHCGWAVSGSVGWLLRVQRIAGDDECIIMVTVMLSSQI